MRRNTQLALGLLAIGVGAAAAAVAFTRLGNRRVDEWETLTPADAGEGDFVELSDGTRMHYIARRPAPGRSAQAGSATLSHPCPSERNERGSGRLAVSVGLPSVQVRNPGSVQDVVLIHGVMDSAFHWHKNIDALADHHRVWAIDLVGFGFSSRPTEPNYSLKRYARHVREFMDAQGIARASIVGHSLGGAVALEFAHDAPERVDKLILIAPATFLLQFRPQVKLAARLPAVSRAIVGYAVTSGRAHMAAWRGAVGDPSRVDLEESEMRLRPRRVKGSAAALIAMLGSPHLSDLPAGLDRIQAPALILWGENDRAVPLRHGGYHARDLPNGELVVLEGAGHIPQNESPQVVNRLMVDFLARGEPR